MKGPDMVKPAMKEIQRRPGVKMEAVCDMAELSKTTIGGKMYFQRRLRRYVESGVCRRGGLMRRAKIYLLGASS
jgi:hypothetical protein